MNINPRDPITTAQVQIPQDALEEMAESGEKRQKSRYRWFWILLSLMLFAVTLTLLSYTEDTVDVVGATSPLPASLVTVEQVATAPQTVEIRTFAEVRPKWSAVLTAPVSGRVDSVFDLALAGNQVEAGTPLLKIEDGQYVAEFAAAELELKQADLALWQAKNATYVARADFKRNNIKPPNDLALKLPQLAIAESAVKSARAQVASAERRLEDTIVTAPFSAFVTERFVSPGQSVNIGDRLVTLTDNTEYELIAEFSPKDWALTKKPLSGQSATVLDHGGNKIAEGLVRSGGEYLDDTTRQYRIFIDIKKSESNAVLGGDLVVIQLAGITFADALDIPASALTKDGFVWRVDSDDLLQRLEPEVLFRQGDRLIIRFREELESLRVATTPLVSFLPGQRVEPRKKVD